MKSKVYFSKEITSKKVLELYKMAGKLLDGNVAIKVHSGEKGNQNFLQPEFWKDIIDFVGGTVVECNTAYEGARYTTEQHKHLMREHGWSKLFYVGKNISKYDSMLVLSHFKGHPMGGYGGAIKQLSIGVASSYGKKYIHGCGTTEDFWNGDHDSFLEAMADAAGSVIEYFNGEIVYVNVMKNMSVDCDCCAVAEDPCIADIGVLVSTDPIAIDQACIDLVYNCSDKGKPHLIERIESRNGIHTIEAAAEHGYGSREYEFVEVE